MDNTDRVEMITLEELQEILDSFDISPDEARYESRFFEDFDMENAEKEELAYVIEDILDIEIDHDVWNKNVFTVEDAIRYINEKYKGNGEDGAERSMNSFKMSNNQSILDDLFFVRDALREKGANPVHQLTGYILGNDPTYITQSFGARDRISKTKTDEILEEIIIFYLNAPGSSELKDNMRYFSEYSVKAGENPVTIIVGRMVSGDPTYLNVNTKKLSYKDRMTAPLEKYYEAARALKVMDCYEALIEMLNEFFSMSKATGPASPGL